MILPGATLGMLGGGQLGRMFVSAAHEMGYQVMVLDPDKGSPAGKIADQHLCHAYHDHAALDILAKNCVAISTEFENIPLSTVQYLEQKTIVRPGSQAIAIAQNRIEEKNFLRQHNIPLADYLPVVQQQDLRTAEGFVTQPAILKVARLGYDGKGQAIVENSNQLHEVYQNLGKVDCVLERKLDLQTEISVILSRSHNGDCQLFPVAENHHKNGILNYTIVPATTPRDINQQARDIAINIAQNLNYCGVMAVEFFVTQDNQLLVNEIAPRPHNSGHYTIDACISSQFEQQVRMLCGLPAAKTDLRQAVVMQNLLGDIWFQADNKQPHWQYLLQESNAKLHLYAKDSARPGRKMGHYCLLGEAPKSLLKQSTKINQLLNG